MESHRISLAGRLNVERPLLRVFDALLCVLLCAAPLAMGGRPVGGRVVYLGLIACLAFVWAAVVWVSPTRRYARLGVEGWILAALGLVISQLVPLPTALLVKLSPRIGDFLPAWFSTTGYFGTWRTLSLSPVQTRNGLIWLLAISSFVIVVYQRFCDWNDLQRLNTLVGVAGFCAASVALAQYLFGNGRFLWWYENPYRSASGVLRGSFYNENHLAHFLALSILPLWCGYRSRRGAIASNNRFIARTNRLREFWASCLGIGVAFLGFAVLLTRSRGGLIVTACAAAIGMLGMSRRGELPRIRWIRLSAAIVFVCVGLTIHGMNELSTELSALTSGSLEQIDPHAGRRLIWQAARDMIGQFTLCGAGVGAFRDAYPLFYSTPRWFDYGYAESGYLNVAAETGMVGILLLGGVMLSLGRRIYGIWLMNRCTRMADDRRDMFVAAAGGLIVSVVHATVDFSWFIPACLTSTICLLVVVLRIDQLSKLLPAARMLAPPLSRGTYECLASAGRPGSLAAQSSIEDSPGGTAGLGGYARGLPFAVMAIGLCCAALRFWNPAIAAWRWDAYLVQSRRDAIDDSRRSTPHSIEEKRQRLQSNYRRLKSIVELDPQFVSAGLHLSSLCMEWFELEQSASDTPMTLGQIRDAAITAEFRSMTEQNQWLSKVLQDRRRHLDESLKQAYRVLSLSPLQGQAYLDLMELEFLRRCRPAADRQAFTSEMIRQALRVRPFDACVLFAAGREAAIEGRLASCTKYWRSAYAQDPQFRETITQQLAPYLSAEVFVNGFNPDLPDLIKLRQAYEQLRQSTQANWVASAYLNRLLDPASQTGVTSLDWQEGYRLAASLNDPRTLHIARQAVSLDPDNEQMRRRLGLELLAHGQWEEAITHLECYVRSHPADQHAADKLASALRQRRRS